MAYPRAATEPQSIERRNAGRARADCSARLQTPGGNWYGRLWDLSETGARVQVDNPPAQGVMCLISWQTHEMFCKVMWAAEDMCGVQFERPIARAIVMETLGAPEPEAPAGPVASVGNIPVGQRRQRFRLAGDS
jgi:hypothetical protein